MRGNCLIYALGMLAAEGFTGRISWAVLRRWPPKLRFYYCNASGERTFFFPDRPRRGWRSCLHAMWFAGHVRKV